MEADSEKGKRITIEQRELMLDFMKSHISLGTGKFTAPDGAKHKQRLLNELANVLNSVSNGVTKSPDKWLKSWQDWRSDTKSKAAMLRREMNKTGGGKINPKAKPLTPLEEQLLGFLGPNIVYGHEEVPDPLATQGHSDGHGTQQVEAEILVVDNDMLIMPLEGPSTSAVASGSSEVSEESNPSSPAESRPKRQKVPSSSDGWSEGDTRMKHTPRKRKDSSLSEVETEEGTVKLLQLSERQVKIAEEDLNLKKRQTKAVEESATAFNGAAAAFCGAMKAMEMYFKRKTGDFFDCE